MPIQLCFSLLCHHNNAITTFCFVSSCSSHHTFFFSVIMTMSSNIMCYFIMSMLLHFPFLCLRVNAFNLLSLSSCQCIPTDHFCVVVSMPLNFPFLGYHVNAITLSVSEAIDKNNTGKCDDIDICQCHHTFLCYRVNVFIHSCSVIMAMPSILRFDFLKNPNKIIIALHISCLLSSLKTSYFDLCFIFLDKTVIVIFDLEVRLFR